MTILTIRTITVGAKAAAPTVYRRTRAYKLGARVVFSLTHRMRKSGLPRDTLSIGDLLLRKIALREWYRMHPCKTCRQRQRRHKHCFTYNASLASETKKDNVCRSRKRRRRIHDSPPNESGKDYIMRLRAATKRKKMKKRERNASEREDSEM